MMNCFNLLPPIIFNIFLFSLIRFLRYVSLFSQILISNLSPHLTKLLRSISDNSFIPNIFSLMKSVSSSDREL